MMNKQSQAQRQGHESWAMGHGVANRDTRFMFHASEGFTLIEIIVVVAVAGILLTIAGFELNGWATRYNVESAVKTMYVDLMNARLRAMQRNRVHFVVLTATQYTIYEDTNPAPDGNGTLETASDTQVLQKTASYTITPSLSLGATQFYFDKNGISSNTGNIRLLSTVTPDYDCIVISSTRINLGQYSGGSCNAK